MIYSKGQSTTLRLWYWLQHCWWKVSNSLLMFSVPLFLCSFYIFASAYFFRIFPSLSEPLPALLFSSVTRWDPSIFAYFAKQTQSLWGWHTHTVMLPAYHSRRDPYWVKCYDTGIPMFRWYVFVKPAAHCVWRTVCPSPAYKCVVCTKSKAHRYPKVVPHFHHDLESSDLAEIKHVSNEKRAEWLLMWDVVFKLHREWLGL